MNDDTSFSNQMYHPINQSTYHLLSFFLIPTYPYPSTYVHPYLSAMLLDTELAEEFVESLVPNLTMEVPYDWNGLTHKGVRMIINPRQQL